MEKEDLQGLIIRSHKEMLGAAYVLLQIQDVAATRSWLRRLLPAITTGIDVPVEGRVQVAFTYPGLQLMGAGDFVREGFAVEFIQGMEAEFRARVLGDQGESDPENWDWGGPENDTLHLVLIVFAPDKFRLEELLSQHLPSETVLRRLKVLHSEPNTTHREHFGFRDGISQPILKGLQRPDARKDDVVPDGEFILGYPNAYGQLPETPLVPKKHDPNGILARVPANDSDRDFGKNGSYLVFRQLEQNVPLFWEQIRRSLEETGSEARPADCIELASKMVGRWPNGTPLALSPSGETPDTSQHNDFLYAEKDSLGHGCPFGAHIRRSNPRDALPGNSPGRSIVISNRHRILRRGRNYGPALSPKFQPEELMRAEDDGQERGLLFLCLNTNISRQFEFVQHTWINNRKFASLYRDPDPVLGITDKKGQDSPFDFTIPAQPIRRKIEGLKRPVRVRGGAYFFLPGLRALRFLAHYQPPHV